MVGPVPRARSQALGFWDLVTELAPLEDTETRTCSMDQLGPAQRRMNEPSPMTTLAALRSPSQVTEQSLVQPTLAQVDRAWDRARAASAADWGARNKPNTRAANTYAELRAKGTPITRDTWFRQYWMERCLQFADRVLVALHGKKATKLSDLVDTVGKAAKDAGAPVEVAGRTVIYRGSTLAALGAAEIADPRLKPGTAIHLKLSFDEDDPYGTQENFHHWVIYRGDGRFSDSLVGKDKSGEEMDLALQAWVTRAFAAPQYAHLQTEPRFLACDAEGKPLARTPAPGLQPLVTAEYDVSD